MARQTARTLLWMALALLLVGGAVGAPEAGVACAALAALCAIAPVVTGSRWVRIAGALLLLASAVLAAALLPAARSSMGAYRERAHRDG